MSWLQKLLPPKIKRDAGGVRKVVPEGLWSKCGSCEAVLYRTDLEKNLYVCPKCGHHNRISARERLDYLLDLEGRYEIGAEVLPVDSLKFKDSRRYTERLEEARRETSEDDALVVMQGSIKTLPVVAAAFEFKFLGGSMGPTSPTCTTARRARGGPVARSARGTRGISETRSTTGSWRCCSRQPSWPSCPTTGW